MDGASLGLHDAAIGVDLPHLVEQRQDPHVMRTPAFSSRSIAAANAAQRSRPDFPAGTLGDAEAKPGKRKRFERDEILAGHDRVGPGAIGDAARQRPDGIERGAQGKRALGRHALAARLEAGDAAERRRDAHRTSGVAADRDLAHAVGDGDRGAGRRAAGHARAIAWIARRAEMRIGADGAEANSVMLVLATITAPAARSRRTTGASAVAGGASSARILSRPGSARRRHRTDP